MRAARDKKFLGRGEGAAKPVVVRGSRGAYLVGEDGTEYLDFVMGWCVGNVGWNVNEIVKKIRLFSGPTYVSPTYHYQGWVELAELLAKITPGRLQKSFRATGGTEAVEIALQAAMSHTKRHGFLSIEGSYHGHSIGAMSVGSSGFRSWYKNLLPNCHKIQPPLDEVAARKVEKILATHDIAAFIAEPIVCNLGVEIPSKKFFETVSRACKKYGTLFIADEVATGFGRTGKMFASEHYHLKPDIMCIAKGGTGGYGALGAAIMTPEVAQSFEFDFSFYSTFGWHPLNVEAATQNLQYLLKHKVAFLKNANVLGAYFEKRLKEMPFRYPPEIRIRGLAIGLKFENRTYVSDIVRRCLKNKLLVADATSQTLVMYPPLDLDLKTAKKGLYILEKSL